MTTINIGGKPRRFFLDVATYRLAEIKHNVVVTIDMLENPTLGMRSMFLWIGLLADDSSLKEEQVLEWLIDMEDASEVWSEVDRALMELGEKGGSEGANPLPTNAVASLTGS